MSYQSNQPGTEITLEEELALAQLAALGSPDQVLTVTVDGLGLYYTDKDGGPNIVNGTVQGQMAFWDASASNWVYTEVSELFWDDVNKKLEVGGDITATELISANSGTINRTAGVITSVAITDGRTLTYTRTADLITSVTDETRTWTFNYTDDLISSWTLS